ncbi:hypothetical protein PQX77_018980 [Marasmius sp. AFHP31]|nr:hypothetical protein PQX77_018980 [Marasmius sp. AFHP31]
MSTKAPPTLVKYPFQQEVISGAGSSSGGPRDIANTGEAHDNEMGGYFNSRPSPRPEPGELDSPERDPCVENTHTSDKGSTPSQPVATGDPASGIASDPVQGKLVGGPDTDKHV